MDQKNSEYVHFSRSGFFFLMYTLLIIILWEYTCTGKILVNICHLNQNAQKRPPLLLQARPATLLKKRLWHRCFSVNFLEFLRTPFLWNTSGGCFCLNIFNTKLDYICLIGWSNSYSYRALKETRNSIKKWPLNLWWVSNKAIIEVGNITKAATFKGFLHLSYKNTQLLFCDSVFSIFQEKIINRWFLWVTQKYELRVSFKPPLNISESCSKNIFWFYCWKHVIVKHLKELS